MHLLARALERGAGGLARLDPPRPQACMLHVYLRGEREALEGCSAGEEVASEEQGSACARVMRALVGLRCAARAAVWHAIFLGFSGFFWTLMVVREVEARVGGVVVEVMGRVEWERRGLLNCLFLMVFLLMFLLKHFVLESWKS